MDKDSVGILKEERSHKDLCSLRKHLNVDFESWKTKAPVLHWDLLVLLLCPDNAPLKSVKMCVKFHRFYHVKVYSFAENGIPFHPWEPSLWMANPRICRTVCKRKPVGLEPVTLQGRSGSVSWVLRLTADLLQKYIVKVSCPWYANVAGSHLSKRFIEVSKVTEIC